MGEVWKVKPAVPVWNTLAPINAGKAVMDLLDFSTDSSIDVSCADEQRGGTVEYVQTLWVDNSINTATLSILVKGTGQVIKVAPKTQGYYSVLSAQEFKATISTTPAASLLVTLGFINVEIEPSYWVLP